MLHAVATGGQPSCAPGLTPSPERKRNRPRALPLRRLALRIPPRSLRQRRSATINRDLIVRAFPGCVLLETRVTLAETNPPTLSAGVRRRPAVRLDGRTLALGGVALALGLVYLYGFLRQLSYRRFPEIIPTDQPLATVLGLGPAGALRFLVPVALAFALYGAAVWLARGLAGRWLAAGALLAAALYAAIFLPTNPVGAQDIYHNVFDARILWHYHANPTEIPPTAYPNDRFFPSVTAWNNFASVYGPVWYVVSGAAYRFGGDDLRANIYGHKALTAAFLLGTAALAYLTAERLRAGSGLAAVIAIAWNPLLLFETAGNGHNDVVMIFFAMAAMYALARGGWLWVFPLLALSVAAKYVSVLLGPPILVWMLRRPEIPRRTIAASLAAGAAVGLAVYLPFFQGQETLGVIRRQSGYTTSSPSALLDALLLTYRHMAPQDSTILMKKLVTPSFLLLYGWLLWRTRGDLAALVERCAWMLLLLLVIATWWFWPWYAIWFTPFAALLPRRGVAFVGVLFSASAMAMYGAYYWLLSRDLLLRASATAAVAFLPPVLAAVALGVRQAARGGVLSRRPPWPAPRRAVKSLPPGTGG